MPFHFCGDELLALMALVPFVGGFFLRVKTWWHVKSSHRKNKCESSHHPCTKE